MTTTFGLTLPQRGVFFGVTTMPKLLESARRADESGQVFVANGDAAIRFWSEGLAELPDGWDLFVPEDLVDTQVRHKPIGIFAKVTSGMDWLFCRA